MTSLTVISKRVRVTFAAAGAAAFVLAGSAPSLAQPAPTMAQCMADAARFDPTDAKLVARVIACDPKHAAENIARLSSARAVAANSQRIAPPATTVTAPEQTPAQPLAFYVNGSFVSAQRVNALASADRGLAVPNALALTRPEDFNFVMADVKRQQLQSAAFNASASADTAGQNEAIRQAELKRKCDYRTTSLGAVSSLLSLASNSPIYTRTQLGILSAVIPVLFSHCDTTIPPGKPVLTLSGDSVEQGSTIKLTALEKGYTGSFTASSSDPATAKIQDPASQTVADGTKGTVAGSATFIVAADPTATGTVTLTVTDDRGTKTTISLIIAPKKSGP